MDDLISMIEKDLGPGKRSGRWTLFRCPFHEDHTPSLAATNGDGQRTPYWKCFTCGDKGGGPLQWLMEYRGLSWKDARAELSADRPYTGAGKEPGELPPPPPVYPPAAAWQARARQIIDGAQDALWGQPGQTPVEWNNGQRQAPLDWLLGRGLTEATLRFWRIGWIPKTWMDTSSRWGLDETPIYMPQGVLIPCMDYDQAARAEYAWYLKVRQPVGKPKYIMVRHSQPALYMIQTLDLHTTAVFTEGEFDALLLWQEAQDMVGVTTLGASTNVLNLATFGFHLLGLQQRLLAYDMDKAGNKATERMAWLQTGRLVVPALRAGDKDITDYYTSGGDLRTWLAGEMQRLSEIGEMELSHAAA